MDKTRKISGYVSDFAIDARGATFWFDPRFGIHLIPPPGDGGHTVMARNVPADPANGGGGFVGEMVGNTAPVASPPLLRPRARPINLRPKTESAFIRG